MLRLPLGLARPYGLDIGWGYKLQFMKPMRIP